MREAIASSYLAVGLDEAGIDLLTQIASQHRYHPGEMMTRQDDLEAHLMILASGRGEIRAYAEEAIYFLRPGMPFGEVSLIDEKPRSATVIAVEESDVVCLPAEDLRALISERPDVGVILLRNLARVLCSRLRASNQQLAAAMTMEQLRTPRS